MTAQLLSRWQRPDNEVSRLRGNVQVLPDRNVFIGWSGDDGYMTEHSAAGDVLVEARFVSKRSSSYRAYKFFDFTATPSQPPSLAAFVFQSAAGTSTSVFYVSWNGATEVRSWRIHAVDSTHVIGQAEKSGFETIIVVDGYSGEHVFAEAMAADGQSLRNSTVQKVVSHLSGSPPTNYRHSWSPLKQEGGYGVHLVVTPSLNLSSALGLMLLGALMSWLSRRGLSMYTRHFGHIF